VVRFHLNGDDAIDSFVERGGSISVSFWFSVWFREVFTPPDAFSHLNPFAPAGATATNRKSNRPVRRESAAAMIPLRYEY